MPTEPGCSLPEGTDALIERLSATGFAVAPGYFDTDLCNTLRDEAIALAETPAGVEAGIGRGPQHLTDKQIRRARIGWIDGTTPPQAKFLARADSLRIAINRHLFLGLFEFEAQVALTPAGGFYRRHLDSFRGARNRVVTLIAYLDPLWRASDGGALRIWPPDPIGAGLPETIEILPERGTLVLMLSEAVQHEVLVSLRPRANVAGWFRVRN